MGHTKISTDIEQNIRQFQQLFADSADIKMKEMRLGKGKKRRCFLAYIEVAVSNMLLETTALGRLLAALSELPDRDLNQVLNENAMGISDVT
ncbi:MAG: spore germination protein, partial [Roseburia faecis]|nr:spore germination protein [Roseburia faecis]